MSQPLWKTGKTSLAAVKPCSQELKTAGVVWMWPKQNVGEAWKRPRFSGGACSIGGMAGEAWGDWSWKFAVVRWSSLPSTCQYCAPDSPPVKFYIKPNNTNLV